MAIEIKMPALSPTMEEGTLAVWLVKEGDSVASGELLAEIETDKATMEFEAVDEGVIEKILVDAGSENVKVGTVIALLSGEGEDSGEEAEAVAPTPAPAPVAESAPAPTPAPSAPASAPAAPIASESKGVRIKASPLAKRLAKEHGIALEGLQGSGPGGRIIKVDIERARAGGAGVGAGVSAPAPASTAASVSAPAVTPLSTSDIPHRVEKLSMMRKTIARRLTESKQQVPHIYLTCDVRLDALLKVRSELNATLASSALALAPASSESQAETEAAPVKLSVNDMLIKALAKALVAVPECNVCFAGDHLLAYERADISVAVSLPAGLITPIIVAAESKSLSAISSEMKGLAARAKAGKLQPHEYQGGTASLSNMGMFGIREFSAVINPPQAMILAVGAGEKRPFVVDDALAVATVMSVTGSFDHRAIDGADGARLMKVLKELIENPMSLVV